MSNQEKKNCLWDDLTPEQVALGASIQPWESLEFCEDKLTDEQLGYCEDMIDD